MILGMWPTIFTIGSFKLSTLSMILFFGFLLTGFSFWRRGKEEHYSELQLFDGFLLSFLVGFLGARASFIIFHWDRFGVDPMQWLNLFGNSGSQKLVLLLVSTLFLNSFAKKKKWDNFEILDFWSLSLTMWLIVTNLGEFFAGTARGYITSSPVGIVFPGSIDKTHPVQLYGLGFFILLHLYLSWAENNYRTFEWYRLGKKAAQTGFLISNFFIFFSLFSLVMLFFRLPEFVVGGRAFDLWIYLSIFFFGVRMLLGRSDKPLLPVSFRDKFKKKKKEEKNEIS
jgi:prolipoprotein diacylglyceryltransferase